MAHCTCRLGRIARSLLGLLSRASLRNWQTRMTARTVEEQQSRQRPRSASERAKVGGRFLSRHLVYLCVLNLYNLRSQAGGTKEIDGSVASASGKRAARCSSRCQRRRLLVRGRVQLGQQLALGADCRPEPGPACAQETQGARGDRADLGRRHRLTSKVTSECLLCPHFVVLTLASVALRPPPCICTYHLLIGREGELRSSLSRAACYSTLGARPRCPQ